MILLREETMKPPKQIVKLGKDAVNLWKLQQALGKQSGADQQKIIGKARCALRLILNYSFPEKDNTWKHRTRNDYVTSANLKLNVWSLH
jgi:hypothetical protein